MTTPTLKLMGGNILEANVERRMPENLPLSVTITTSGEGAAFWFPLLNPGDEAHIDLLVSSANPSFTVDARIVGIDRIRYIPISAKPASLFSKLSWASYIVIVGTALCGIASLIGLYRLGQETAIASLTRDGAIGIPSHTTVNEWRTYLDHFKGLKSLELKPIREFLTKASPGADCTDVQRRVTASLTDVSTVISGIYIFAPFAVIGFLYLAGTLLDWW